MKKGKLCKSLLCLILVVSMLVAYVVPASATNAAMVTFKQVDNSAVQNPLGGRVQAEDLENSSAYKDTDEVRVSIVLKDKSTIEAGFSTQGIATNMAAMNYRDKLEETQASVTSNISKKLGEELDVVWNLTLAANIISANVKYGQIATIEKVPGVQEVLIETRYEPDVVSTSTADPNMATSSAQIGSAAAWSAGYTGAGSRIAIIDTGTDYNHQSFNEDAFLYSLGQLAGDENVDAYIAGLNLLDADEIASVVDKLNVSIDPNSAYKNSKVPYGVNYVDGDYDITHLNDSQGEHGSHVSGIAAANAYIADGKGGYVSALSSVFVQGVAPDAQIISMKVFGKNGGAYDSDYMAAIEDAIILGCDSVNLSLGSGNPGMSRNATAEYQRIMDELATTDTVVCMSAGNSGYWAESAESGLPYLYLDDVSFQTDGTPGSYTNAFTVASVDNDGTTGYYISVGDTMIFYAETEYSNEPLNTLAGEQAFVLIDGFGTSEDWAGINLEGKIALCSRGEISFFEKAINAVEAGAIATIIYNNQPGIINMDLTGYPYTAPCISVTQADGAAIKAASTPVTDDAGNVLYYTGTMNVSEGKYAGQYNSEYYTLSSFSSWGVPGSLELKPEITAPGGSINSVFGAVNGGTGGNDQYEVMSGTSMASPQVAGMSAIMAQYIRENGLDVKTGLTVRALAQSLLMSTAVPLRDGNSSGNYYPVIQQGAGLANVGAAIIADSYILMGADATASYADGKVKAELGDDPDKTGVYSFSFTINNLTNEQKNYVLSADVFTQDAWSYSGILLLDTWTTGLTPTVAWTVNGQSATTGEELVGLDFNGDGNVNTVDGQILLDYATGMDVTLYNEDKADLNGDGEISSYDSYLFFTMLNEGGAVVPANGSAEVTVTITLSDDDKEWLAYYENGAYIEAYVYAESLSSAEGVEGTTHSIPVLAYYGNWSDPSMFDKGSFVEFYHGLENRPPYLYSSAYSQAKYNGLLISYSDMDGEYWFGGNPMVTDETYMPERDAISAARGDIISKIGFTAIRNAADSYYQVINTETGEAYISESLGAIDSAYYYVNGGTWRNTYYTLNTGFSPVGIPEGTSIELGLTLIPEYYVDAEGNVNWDALGDGVTFSMPMVVDNTAPKLDGVRINQDLMTGAQTLEVTATDNQYIAAIALFDNRGQYLYTYTGSNAEQAAGDTVEFALDLTEVNGASFLLQVYDYAMNTTTYEITTQIGEVTDEIESIEISETELVMQLGTTKTLSAIVYPANASNRDVTWSTSDDGIVSVDENGKLTANAVGSAVVTATSVADETVSTTCEVEVIDISAKLNGIVWDEEGSIWFSEFAVNDLPNYEKLSPDMLDQDYFVSATVGADGTLYASSLNTNSGTGSLYTIDPETYEATFLADCAVQGINIFYSDLTYAPAMFGTGVLLGTYGPYVMVIDPATGEALGIVDEFESDLVGIATCYGEYDADTGEYLDAVYVILNDGTVIQEIYYGYEGMVIPYFYYFYGERASMDTGVNVGNAWYFNSAYYDGEYLYWSAFDQDTENEVTLYAIDADYSGNVYNMGTFADGVWPVGGLYQADAINSANAASEKLAEISAKVAELGMPEAREIELEVQDIFLDASSALNNLDPEAVKPVLRPMSDATVGMGEETITVTITAQQASNNGITDVTWDADSLTLVDVVMSADYTSVNKGDGTVTLGYIQMDGYDADDVVATLYFEVKSTEAESVTVTYKEINDGNPDTPEDLPVDYPHSNTEVRDAKDATCTEDGYTGDTWCTDCETKIASGETIPALGHDWADATCTEPKTCKTCGETEGDALGHDWADATCTEPKTCKTCGETEGDALGHDYEAVVTEPTCTEDGYTTHTCSVCGDSYTDSTVEATGHSFKDGVCENCDAEDPDYVPDSSDVPSTDDTFPAAMMVLVLLALVSMLTVLVLNRKKFFVK